MAKKVKDTDYLFISTYLHSRERDLLTAARMERMIEAPTAEDAAKVLTTTDTQLPAAQEKVPPSKVTFPPICRACELLIPEMPPAPRIVTVFPSGTKTA